MIRLNVSDMGGKLQALYGALGAMGAAGGIGLNTHRALSQSGSLIVSVWQAKAAPYTMRDGSEIPVASLIRKERAEGNSVSVIAQRPRLNGYQDSIGWMERQEKPWDMRASLPFGLKSRRSKNGEPYLIVPLRHRLSSLPAVAARRLRSSDFKSSFVVQSPNQSGKASANAHGALIDRAVYNWGSRFQDESQPRSIYNGMVKMAAGKSSVYTAFRAISPHSKGWIRKARPVLLPDVIKEVMPDIADLLQSAFLADLGMKR